ncbi:hypothetical protein WDW89_02435 [Deltaproteobacteria bacterium TL4]
MCTIRLGLLGLIFVISLVATIFAQEEPVSEGKGEGQICALFKPGVECPGEAGLSQAEAVALASLMRNAEFGVGEVLGASDEEGGGKWGR